MVMTRPSKKTPLRRRIQPRVPEDLHVPGSPPSDAIEWDGLACSDVDLPPELDALVVTASHLRNVRLTGCRIHRFEARDVVFEDCELSGAFVSGALLERVEFRRCRMSGIDLSRATARDVLFDGCRLDEANFRAATLVSIDTDGCELRDSDFYGARIERSNLLRSNLTGADFSKCRLERVLLHGSILIDVKGGAALAGSIISRDQVIPLAPALITAIGIVIDDDFRDAATPA
jgi:uncharacterized protein YjbI with pentapeptide repeats